MAARIYQRARNAMQSGRARAGDWILEFESARPQHQYLRIQLHEPSLRVAQHVALPAQPLGPALVLAPAWSMV